MTLLQLETSAAEHKEDRHVSAQPFEPELHTGEDLGEASVSRDSSVALLAPPSVHENITETPPLQASDFIFTYKPKEDETVGMRAFLTYRRFF